MGSFPEMYNDPEIAPSAVRCTHPVDVLREKSDVNTVKFRK